MSFTKARIANCSKASIRKKPWDPNEDKELVGLKDGPLSAGTKIDQGDVVYVNLDDICYDWTGRKYYKVRRPEGWIPEGVISIERAG